MMKAMENMEKERKEVSLLDGIPREEAKAFKNQWKNRPSVFRGEKPALGKLGTAIKRIEEEKPFLHLRNEEEAKRLTGEIVKTALVLKEKRKQLKADRALARKHTLRSKELSEKLERVAEKGLELKNAI